MATLTRIIAPFSRVSKPIKRFMFKTGESFSAARYLNVILHLTRKTPKTMAAELLALVYGATFIPITIPKAGVRAVVSNPEFKFVTYCSRLINGAAPGSKVCNHARS